VADPLVPVVVVGHAARDLVGDDRRGWRLGGSATYVSHAIARLGVPVRAVIGTDADAATSRELALLEAAGVEVYRVRLETGPIFENVETPAGRRQRCLGVGRPLESADMPDGWGDAHAWAIVPVLGEVAGEAWAALPDPGALVVLGWQGMLRAARAGGPTVKLPPYPDPVVQRADVVVVGTDDLVTDGDAPGDDEVETSDDVGASAPTTRWESSSAADTLADLFPRAGQQLALTAGERGGRLFQRTSGGWTSWPYRAASARVVDWTGAGDVFLAAYLATGVDPSLAGDAVPDRLDFAATVAAMSIEGPGITTIPTRDEARTRLAATAG
jgi:sugar/nucleoside kinase (ribokinase family)